MKKIVLLLSAILSFAGANAQPFSVSADTVWHPYYQGYFAMYNGMTNNTTGPMIINWHIVPSATNLLPSWISDTAFGICDNGNCHTNVAQQLTTGTVFSTVNCPPGILQGYYAGLDFTLAVAGSGYFTVRLSYGSYTKDIVFVIGQFPTNVSGTSTLSELLSVYPVPARNLLNVKYAGEGTVKTISIFDVTGKAVAAHSIQDNEAQLDVSGLAGGVYFLRLTDAQGVLLGTKKFSKQ